MGARAVFLVGFMAAGKSSVGQELARRLNWDFVDLDVRIELREGQTVPEIFGEHGESGFRLAESSALEELIQSIECNSVVALGGGTFAQPGNRILLQSWPTVFLDAPMDELWRRSLEDATKRPLRKGPAEFADLYEYRLHFHREATIRVETSGRDLASICTEIERALQLRASHDSTGLAPSDPTSLGTGESQ